MQPDLPDLHDHKYVSESAIVAKRLVSQVAKGLRYDGIIWANGQLGIKFGNALYGTRAETMTTAKWRTTLAQILAESEIQIASENYISHSNACITGVTALAAAQRKISSGEWQRAIVLIQELRCRDWVLWPYYKMGLLSRGGEAKPFCNDRDGFVKGEGGAIFVLESEKALQESGATPFCKIAGYAYCADGSKMFEPRADFSVAKDCVNRALKNADLKSGDIDYVNLYGSGSLKCDRMEASLMKNTFGEQTPSIPMSTIKPQVGHLNTGAAAIELLATALMIKHQTVTPTLNLQNPDPECDLDLVAMKARPAKIRHALKLAFGFGWSNSAMILSHV